jgi:flagellar basal-body rod modification protein FlgD
MSVTASSAITSAVVAGAETGARVPAKTLSQEDFLKILVTQITSQNPLQPNADLSSITQMAQFTALEQVRQMQEMMQRLGDAQQRMQAAALLGRSVAFESETLGRVEGVVEAVAFDADGPQLLVNGQLYPLWQVSSLITSAMV